MHRKGPFLTPQRTAFRKTSGSGNNRVSWNRTLVVAVLTGITAGLYLGKQPLN
ncbi:hypothetical protein ACWDV4_05315 [Micromonospora sp. NPDC003197]